MSRADFDRFVTRQQAEEKAAKAFDPAQELVEWRHYLQLLFESVAEYMKSYISQGTAKIDYRDVELNEEFSGPYTVQEMLLKIGASTVVFKPVGTMLIGAKGRVDVQGPRGSARIALVNKALEHPRQLIKVTTHIAGEQPSEIAPMPEVNIEWAWKLITPAPDIRFITLNQDVFFDMVLAIVDA
ncbi:hypothetical protein [Pseudochelatococcus sp. G4_1912]|uniref:hypothetical protein n=1 Tax=Pseudochelatococcus sp. G4_1912 TaxID=3114288 RepID=UPI0039C6FFC8